MTWFKELTDFQEISPDQVRQNITVENDRLISRINGQDMVYGRLEIPSLAELRERVRSLNYTGGRLSLREVVADVQELHVIPSNAGSLFQVASQFNLLEMASPDVTPERGVGIYENDHTQGPACAVAAGAGTIYRNYFVPVNRQIGQSESNQIDCLADLGLVLGNVDSRLWQMRNGYALATKYGLTYISDRLKSANEDELDQLRERLRIGVQWNTQVTLDACEHLVTQAYCAALPVAYSKHSSELWQEFARLVLEAAYEATLCAAIVNSHSTGNNRLFLTLLGGGVFGNKTQWIIESLKRALRRYEGRDLDVAIVSYGRPNRSIGELVATFS